MIYEPIDCCPPQTFAELMESLAVCHPDAIAAEVERAFGPRADGNEAWGEFDRMVSGEGETCGVMHQED